jgi:diguanylate cyclase (GGDEF)-like protein/PAS domain S-box-containing protein
VRQVVRALALFHAVLLALLCSLHDAEALELDRAATQHQHDFWGEHDGLPDGGLLAVHAGSDGYLWCGTRSGLVRFDGERFESFGRGERGLGQASFAHDIVERSDGSLWTAFAGGVARYANNRFSWFDERSGLTHPFVYALAERGDALWAGTGGTGVWTLREGRFEPHPAYAADPSLPGKISDLALGTDGTLWAATDQGLLALGQSVRRFSTDDGLPSSSVNVVQFDHSGTLWIGTREGLASTTNGSAPTRYAPLSGQNVTALYEDSRRTLWIGTSAGLFRRTDAGILPFPLTRVGVQAITEDGQGGLWLGTTEGLERYRDAVFTTTGSPEGWPEDEILAVLSRRAGGYWVLDARGAISIVRGAQAEDAYAPGSIPGAGMLGMAETPDGSLWVASEDLLELKDGRVNRHHRDGGGFSVLAPDGDGLLVAQTDVHGESRLSRFEHGSFVPLPVPAALRHVQRLFRDRKQRLWISTGGTGLVRVSPSGTKTFRVADGLPSDIVYGVTEDAHGAVWVATRAGLAVVRGDEARDLSRARGTPQRAPNHLYLDDRDNLWATADDGVYRMSLGELNSAANGTAPGVSSDRFGTRDGLRTTEVSWRCSGMALGSDGSLVYATSRGLSRFAPSKLRLATSSPSVGLESASLAGVVVSDADGTLRVVNRRDGIEIRYTSPELDSPSSLAYRYQLQGYDRDWVAAGAARAAHYGNLPPGSYRFVVAVRRHGGPWGAPASLLQIVVQPSWFETPYVRILASLALLLVGYAGYRLRVLQLRRAERVLTEKVAARTHELELEVRERQAAEARANALAEEQEARVRERTIELELANLAARRTEERYALAARGAQDGIWDWDLAGGYLYLSPRWKEMLGYSDGDLASTFDAWLSLICPEDRPGFRSALALSPEQGGQIRCEYRMLHRDGHEIWVLCRGVVVFDDQRNAVRAAGSQTDITARKRAEAERQRDATHDALTGLPNRSLFADRLGQAILQANPRALGVLFVDIDDFKSINDTFGHAIGDRLLKEIAKRWNDALRPIDTLARLASDEFAVLLPQLPDPSYATETAAKLQQLLLEPFELGVELPPIAASIGVKLGTIDKQNLDDFLRDAGLAMSQAKQAGKGLQRVFEPQLRHETDARNRLEADLRRALVSGEFVLHYQPLVSLTSGVALGVEALLRWNHPQRGLLGPQQFLGVAEACGLMVPLSRWVLSEACQQAARWQLRLGSPVRIAINLPPVLLHDPKLAADVGAALERHGLPGAALGIEIVENSVLETQPSVLRNLHGLRALGVTIAIDDFGTGYSSFSYLRQLPVNYLKIDRSLTQRIASDPTDRAIYKALLNMAEQLQVGAVIEGVETQEQVDYLRSSGCKIAQGYFFCRPLPAAECTQFLADNLRSGLEDLPFAPTLPHLAASRLH